MEPVDKKGADKTDADKRGLTPDAPEGAAGKPADEAAKGSGVKGTRALRKLRDRVELVAHELLRLREENAALQKRIEELEAMPAGVATDGAGVLVLDADPEALKRKVEGFIQSIDNYLENKESSE